MATSDMAANTATSRKELAISAAKLSRRARQISEWELFDRVADIDRLAMQRLFEDVKLGKGTIMSHRSVLLAAVLLGVVSIVTVSSDAFARPGRGFGGVGGPGVGAGRPGVGVGRPGVGHVHHVHRHPVARGAAVVGVGAAAAGAYYARPQCGYYPYPPCY